MPALDTIHAHNERDLEAGHATPPSSLVTGKARRRNSCRRFACVALIAVAAVAIALAAFLGTLYVVLDPKMPLYTVHALNVTAFGMDDDMTARARFDAAVRFENPNRAIGISYEEGRGWLGGVGCEGAGEGGGRRPAAGVPRRGASAGEGRAGDDRQGDAPCPVRPGAGQAEHRGRDRGQEDELQVEVMKYYGIIIFFKNNTQSAYCWPIGPQSAHCRPIGSSLKNVETIFETVE
uniref:Late embryogenesis abundant protein LEA-2 subgroup domain-containing protein n=1 Tax=Aegilops tauschii TaxID=37682 RepID=M8BVJ4_AEGTA